MSAAPLVGATTIVRLILRQDRLRFAVWVLAMGLAPWGVASATASTYSTDAERLAFAGQVAANPAELATRGPVFAASIGGLTAWTFASSGVLIGGVLGILLVIRHTRAEEQAGRRELLGAGVLGRQAPLVAAMLVVAAGNTAAAALAFGE